MSAPVPRFLLPRRYLLSYNQLGRPVIPWQVGRHTIPISRNASASTSKPRVLEKPTKFNPPSHGKRVKEELPRHYGPQLTREQKAEQQTKQYPHMMPPEGTWMYWFLTSRGIHTFICLVRRYLNIYFCYPKDQAFYLICNTKAILSGYPRLSRRHHCDRKLAFLHQLP